MKALERPQHISHYKSMGIFPDAQGQLTLQSVVGSSRNSNSVETFIVVPVTYKNEEDPIKNEGARVATRFPRYNSMGAICCHGNEISDPIWPKILMQPFPHPNDASDKIWLQSAGPLAAEIFMFERVMGHTNTQADAGLNPIVLAHFMAQVECSGELITCSSQDLELQLVQPINNMRITRKIIY